MAKAQKKPEGKLEQGKVVKNTPLQGSSPASMIVNYLPNEEEEVQGDALVADHYEENLEHHLERLEHPSPYEEQALLSVIQRGKNAQGTLDAQPDHPERRRLQHLMTEGQLATHELAMRNMKVAFKIIRRFKQPGSTTELAQLAYSALLATIEHFDPSKKVRLSTYLEYQIKNELSQHQNHILSEHFRRQIKKLDAIEEQFAALIGREATPAELALALDWTEEQVFKTQQLKYQHTMVYLDTPTEGDDPFHHFIPAPEREDQDLEHDLSRLLLNLNPQEQALLQLQQQTEAPTTVRDLGLALRHPPQMVQYHLSRITAKARAHHQHLQDYYQ